MRKIQAAAALLVLCLILSGCSLPWSTFDMGEVLPPILDEFTWLPLLDSVTVTRVSDGAEVTVSGTDTELLYGCFEGNPCTRRSGTVTEMNDTFRLFWMKVVITNQKGEKVLRGKMRVGVLHEGE